MKIVYKPIGVIHSPFKNTDETPTQPSRSKGSRGTVELFEEYAEGLSDLDGFSHIILLCHMHESKDFRLKVVPHLDTEIRGLFATRSPNRPNPIGLSLVKLIGIEDKTLTFEGVDFIDGTPVLDIKPYLPNFDSYPDAEVPEWVRRHLNSHFHGGPGRSPAAAERRAARPEAQRQDNGRRAALPCKRAASKADGNRTRRKGSQR